MLARICIYVGYVCIECIHIISLLTRGYDRKALKQASEKALGTPRRETLTYKAKTGHKRPPMVVTHNPCNPPLKQWVAELQRDVIGSSGRMGRVLPEPPLIAERNCKSLKNLLMPTKLPAPSDAVAGNFKCERSKCLICQQHLVETGSFKSERTGERFTIRHRMTCDSSNIVYLLYCDTCSNTQYIGETKNSLRTRFYQHRSNINTNTGTHVTRHFNLQNHTLSNMKCLAIERVHTDDTEKRQERESFWIRKMKTLFPLGLNMQQ